ncbi:MAG: hypothetical protein QOI57_793 [Rubrobacteraceae bacterium]|nr:hypothetical protein [Rubrobacteraceae bacterium]
MRSVTLASKMRRAVLVTAGATSVAVMMALSAAPAMAEPVIPEHANPVITEPANPVITEPIVNNDLGLVSF